VTAAFNEGRGWVSYFGHGSGTAWASVNPYFTNADVKALQNTGMLPVITDISCDNGHFDKDADCFAEVWIKTKEDAGAAGIFSASRSTPFGWTDYLGRGVAVGHFKKGFLTFGGSAYFGKIYMYNNYPQQQQPGGTTEEVMQHYLVFGDPELNIWSDTPAETAVELPTELEAGSAEVVAVTVTVNGAGLERALVHLWVEGGIDVAGRTDAQGKASFDLGALDAGDVVNVMVTGPNALPYEGSIDVVAPPPPADDDDDNADDDASDDDNADDDAPTDDDDNGDDDDSGSSGGCG
jgi:hypothetical protein